MQRQSFIRHFISPSIPAMFLQILLCCGIWFAVSFINPSVVSVDNISLAASELMSLLPDFQLIPNIISLALCIFNAFLISLLNTKHTLIRTRSFLPTFIFMLLMSVWKDVHVLYFSHLALSFFLFSLFFFMNMFRNPKAVEQAYMGSFLLACAGLIIPQYFFIIVICWISFISYQAFSLRTFLASLFGLLTPCILYLVYLFYVSNGNIDFQMLWNYFQIELNTNFDYLSINEIIYFAAILIIFILCAIFMYVDFSKDVLRTRKNLNFFVFFIIFSVCFRLLYSQAFAALMPLTSIGTALILSHSFTLKRSKLQAILFLSFCLINIIFAISELYF